MRSNARFVLQATAPYCMRHGWDMVLVPGEVKRRAGGLCVGCQELARLLDHKGELCVSLVVPKFEHKLVHVLSHGAVELH